MEDGKSFFRYGPELTLGAGGGVDVRMSDRIAFRAIQLDHINAGQNKPKRVRLSSGLVVRFDSEAGGVRYDNNTPKFSGIPEDQLLGGHLAKAVLKQREFDLRVEVKP